MLYDIKTPEAIDLFIAQHIRGAFSTFDMERFIQDVSLLQPGQTYLEVGVDQGKSLLTALISAKEGVNIVGVDLYDAPERQELFKRLGLSWHATFIHGNSPIVSRTWSSPIHVLFIDGDHSYDGCKCDIDSWTKFVPKGGVIYFHDCDETSPGVMQSVREKFGDKVELLKTPEKNTSMARIVI